MYALEHSGIWLHMWLVTSTRGSIQFLASDSPKAVFEYLVDRSFLDLTFFGSFPVDILAFF